MSDETIFNVNRRIHEAHHNGERIMTSTMVPKGVNPDAKCSAARPMPGVIILVHGVNDVGEAYATQAKGLCEGLNTRLGRSDLTSGNWDVARACRDNRVASYQRRAEQQGYNPIIPFYWGYRPVDKATYDADRARYEEELRRRGPEGAEAPYDAYYIDGRTDPRRGFVNVDCFENPLDDNFAKNGGVFANATTTLIDMWGPGSDISGLARFGSKWGSDLSHAIYENPHRIYLVNAAQRLANLILMIRRENPKTRDDSINLVAHSQGTLVAMLANFLVGQMEERPADALIFNHSPYSLETPFLEAHQSYGPQQSRRARSETLANFCQLIDAGRTPAPAPQALVRDGFASSKVADSPTHLRDNHGKVFNYFCPHDQTVSLPNVQGIGWKGVPPAVADRLGAAFAQRVFANGRSMHTPPGPFTLPELDLPAPSLNVSAGQVRNINAAPLPDLGYAFSVTAGCATLGSSDWHVNTSAMAEQGRNVRPFHEADPRPGARPLPRDYRHELTHAELAEVQTIFEERGENWTLIRGTETREGLFMTRYMTAEELRERARNTPTETSNHSAIVLDETASRCVAAFDLAIGRCKSYDTCKLDGGEFWQKLLRVADWRNSRKEDDRPYYAKGILPEGIKKQMSKPPAIPGIVNESRGVALFNDELRRVDEKIADMERSRSRWPAREWHERMRDFERQRQLIEQRRNGARTRDARFPVVHGE